MPIPFWRNATTPRPLVFSHVLRRQHHHEALDVGKNPKGRSLVVAGAGVHHVIPPRYPEAIKVSENAAVKRRLRILGRTRTQSCEASVDFCADLILEFLPGYILNR